MLPPSKMEEFQLYSRRKFIKASASAVALAALANSPLHALAAGNSVKLTILHTNDWHSRIEPFPPGTGQYAGTGGAAVRAAVIKRIRSEEKNVLLLDAGDIFQGTPYFNFFKGELEYKLMSEMGYDAATLGNHDFDNGLEGLISMLPNASFPFINCNYDFTGTILKDKVHPFRIFKKQGVKIGVLGVGVELQGLVPDGLFGNTIYNDPVMSANKIANELKHIHGCDLVICLSHLGYKYQNEKISDVVLAKQSKNIDLIIGGHTHTFLSVPDVQKNAEGKDVTINQVGWAGINLGRIDYIFTPAGKPVQQGTSSVVEICEGNC